MDSHRGRIRAFDPSDGLSGGVWPGLEVLLVGIFRNPVQILKVQRVFMSRNQMRAFVIQDTLRYSTEHTLCIWGERSELEPVAAAEVTADPSAALIPTFFTFSVVRCGKMNRSPKEEMKIKYERHLILTNHAVGCTAAPGTSHTA